MAESSGNGDSTQGRHVSSEDSVSPTASATPSVPEELSPLIQTPDTVEVPVPQVRTALGVPGNFSSLGIELRPPDSGGSSLAQFLDAMKPEVLRGVSMETERCHLPQHTAVVAEPSLPEDCRLYQQKHFSLSEAESDETHDEDTRLKVPNSSRGDNSLTRLKMQNLPEGGDGPDDTLGHSENLEDRAPGQHDTEEIEASLGSGSAAASQDFRWGEEFSTSENYLPLPDDKKYHVFFSYCCSDRPWVMRTVDYLENERRLKCSYHERDFHGGKSIIRNIDEHIEMSVKTVIVLTPDFLESEWCSHEAEVVMHLSVDRREDLLIPVLLKPCDVPGVLRHLTYIDVRPEAGSWAERLVSAITAAAGKGRGQAPLPNSRSAFFFNPNYYNLDKLCVLRSTYTSSGETLDAPHLPEELSNRGVCVPPEEHRAAVNLVDRASHSDCGYCLDHMRPNACMACCGECCCAIFLILLSSGVLGFSIYALGYGVGSFVMIFVSLAGEFLPYICQLGLCMGCQRVRKKRMYAAMKEVNRIYFRHDVLAGVTTQIKFLRFFVTKLHLFYFNPEPCRMHVAELLRRNDGKAKPLENNRRRQIQSTVTFVDETQTSETRQDSTGSADIGIEQFGADTTRDRAANLCVHPDAPGDDDAEATQRKLGPPCTLDRAPRTDSTEARRDSLEARGDDSAPLISFDLDLESLQNQPQDTGTERACLGPHQVESSDILENEAHPVDEGACSHRVDHTESFDNNRSSMLSTEETCRLQLDASDAGSSAPQCGDDDGENIPLIPSEDSDGGVEERRGYDARALQLLLSFSQAYIKKVIDGTLVVEGRRRHTRQVACLCQYVEERIVVLDRIARQQQMEV